MNLIPSPDFTQGQLADLIATGRTLTGAKVDLYQTDIPFSPFPPLATFTAAVATYTGYAQGTIVWSAVSQADDGSYEIVGTCPEFRPTAPVAVGNSIYGLYVSNAGGTKVLLAARFDNPPLPMADALHYIDVFLRVRCSENGIVTVVS